MAACSKLAEKCPFVNSRGKKGKAEGPFFTHKFGNQIQVWKHAKYLVKQIGPLTLPQTFGLKNFHHHHDTLDKSKAVVVLNFNLLKIQNT